MPQTEDVESASLKLRQWLEAIADPNVDPFPDGQPDAGPIAADAVVITHKQSNQSREDMITDGETSDRSNGTHILPADVLGVYANCDSDLLQGRAKVITRTTSVVDCFFRDGVIHGPLRRIDLKKFREFRRQLGFFGRFRSGVAHGPCWCYREGGGFLFGHVDSMGTFSGDQIAYIYPDLESAWLGHFQNGVLLRARQTRVERVQHNNGVVVPVFAAPAGPEVDYCKSTALSMGTHLTVRDPYETAMVECRSSSVGSNAGEGLFARRDLPEGTIVAFYNGVRLPYVIGGPKEEWSTSGYKIYINADYKSGERMNIPPEYVSVDAYCATLGHKMNHSFDPNCAEWFFAHPRFGVLPCERTTRPVRQGEELLLDYEYDPYNCPEWFHHALVLHAKSARSVDDLSNLNARYHRFVQLELGIDCTYPVCRQY